MNTRADATIVLCYGDSNTWGQTPDMTGRYTASVRWPGKLQDILGDNYDIIEKGLNSRTIDLDYPNRPDRNGKTYLLPCLLSHNPIDIVIVMLGTNDLKIAFNRSVKAIATSLESLVHDIKENATNRQKHTPKIIIVSPIYIDDTAPHFKKHYTGYYNHAAAQKSQLLASAFATVAANEACQFVDASTVSQAGIDGIHFSETAHPALAKLLANTILNKSL